MKRHRTHQIDERARRLFQNALPASWVLNEQHRDYAKDYLVEIGDDNAELTGSSFYVQLKGQETTVFIADGTQARFSLKSKYATYYFDKIKDLPVFLVLVNVKEKKGWWLFLQPFLDADQSWRTKGSITVSLPAANDITDTGRLRQAVDDAKKWMRLHHPVSIYESVIAHKERIRRTDPRFDVEVSLVNDKPMFTLLAKRNVPMTLRFTGDGHKLGKKITDLVDKGVKVAFQAGEIAVTGTKLFETLKDTGCELQLGVHESCVLTLVCRDSQGTELARLNDIPGQLRGGRKELWLDADLPKSPFVVTVGPLGEGLGGSVKMTLKLRRWDGQRILQLAHFPRLHGFFEALPTSVVVSIDCQQDGNSLFSMTLPFQHTERFVHLSRYLYTILKARRLAERFHVNSVWKTGAFDLEAIETVEQLYAVFFEHGWTQPMPHVKVTADFVKDTFRHDVVKNITKPEDMKLAFNGTMTLLGDKIEVGRLIRHFTQMTARLQRKSRSSSRGKHSKVQKKGRVAVSRSKDSVPVVFVGTESTSMTLRVATPED